MSTAREEILDRIRTAVGPHRGPRGDPGRGRRRLRRAAARLSARAPRGRHVDIVALFAERAADYRAVVERVPEAGLPAAIARVLAGLPTFMVPDGVPAAVAGRP